MNVISAILLNEHPVKGCIQDGNGKTKPFPIFAIDGLPLNIWISKTLVLRMQTLPFQHMVGYMTLKIAFL
jgi:hypothetical protein